MSFDDRDQFRSDPQSQPAFTNAIRAHERQRIITALALHFANSEQEEYDNPDTAALVRATFATVFNLINNLEDPT